MRYQFNKIYRSIFNWIEGISIVLLRHIWRQTVRKKVEKSMVYSCRTWAYSNRLMHAIVARIKLPFFKIFSNFVHFCPNFQISCLFLPFFWKLACMPFLPKIGPDNKWFYWNLSFYEKKNRHGWRLNIWSIAFLNQCELWIFINWYSIFANPAIRSVKSILGRTLKTKFLTQGLQWELQELLFKTSPK